MIRYYLDTELTDLDGEIISLALVCEDGRSLYLVTHELPESTSPWVLKNVVPFLYDCPEVPLILNPKHWGHEISEFIYGRAAPPQIIADWPTDIVRLCEALRDGSGRTVHMDNQTHFTVVRHIKVYPTEVKGAVQHNAWWDAVALKRYVETDEGKR